MATAVKVRTKKARLARVSASALYLYGISKPFKGKLPNLPQGVDGQNAVRALHLGEFAGWVSPVDAETFAAEIERNMEDLDWLADATIKHQQVVSAVATLKGVTLLPARFGTIFSGERALAADVTTRRAELKRGLARVSGADEWGVKVSARATRRSMVVNATSGKDYLQQKARSVSSGRTPQPDAAIESLRHELEQVARGSSSTGKVSGAQPGLQWQATFLLPRANRRKWDSVLRKYAEEWGDARSIECTGPWPPYSFVTE